MMAIPLMFSIAEGIGLGLLAATALAVATGRARRRSPTAYVLAAVFFLEFFGIFPFGG